MSKHNTFCGRICGGSCGVIVTVEDGKVIMVDGDPEFSMSKGYICPKGRAIPGLMNHPDRIFHPLKRVGPRGKGRWERISPEAALDVVAENLRRVADLYGPESIILHRGAYRGGLNTQYMLHLAKILGTPNTANVDNICNAARSLACVYTYGTPPTPDYYNPPKCILVWGKNSIATGADSYIALFHPENTRNTKILVVDPSNSSVTDRTTSWLQPRPGSDGFLALAMIKAIIEEGLHDFEFVEEWVTGFDELADMVNEYSYEELEELTWVNTDEMKEFARVYATTKPAVIQTGNALDQTRNAFQTCRLISILRALTGNLDVPGGEILNTPVRVESIAKLEVDVSGMKPPIGAEYKLAVNRSIIPSQEIFRAAVAGEGYPLKASIVIASNPMITYTNTETVYKALQGLEFIVVLEHFMTPTASMADIVLPAAFIFEYTDLSSKSGYIALREKLVEPPGECKSDPMWLSQIAGAMGKEEHFWGSEEEAIEYALGPSGTTLEKLRESKTHWSPYGYRKYMKGGFNTPSGKVEIMSSRLREFDLSPIPRLDAMEPNPEGYPLILTSRKNPYYYHSSQRQIVSLRKLSPEPVVEVNGATARRLGLKEGEVVYVETPSGRISQRLEINNSLNPNVVYASYGWWFPEEGPDSWRRSNLNMLTDNKKPLCPAMGAPTLRGIPCKLSAS